MKIFSRLAVSFLAIVVTIITPVVVAEGHGEGPNVDAVEYADGDFPLLGYVSIPEGATETPVPGVVIVVRYFS